MVIADYIQLGICIATIVTSSVSCYAIINTRNLAKEQYKFQFFTEYTRRYQELMLNMPKDIDISSIYNKDIDVYMRLYFDLCSEEYYLHSKGVIDNKVWGLWVDGISTAMNKQKYKTAWKLLGSYYDDENFVHFMNNLTREKG